MPAPGPAPRTGRARRSRPSDAETTTKPPADPDALARVLCLRQLEARSRTRVELARYLARKGIPDDAAGRVLDRLGEVGLIDDAALATLYASSRQVEQGLARRAIAVKLRQRGVDDDLIAGAVATIEPDDEWTAARRLVAKRRRGLVGVDRVTQSRRLVGMLARKGYPAQLAYAVVREALAGAELDSDCGVADGQAAVLAAGWDENQVEAY